MVAKRYLITYRIIYKREIKYNIAPTNLLEQNKIVHIYFALFFYVRKTFKRISFYIYIT